jgi:hypothetical protein
MKEYVATFHTHLGALLTYRALQLVNIAAYMAPVPRKLSASCGTCVFYRANVPELAHMTQDVEGVYEIIGEDEYLLIYENT